MSMHAIVLAAPFAGAMAVLAACGDEFTSLAGDAGDGAAPDALADAPLDASADAPADAPVLFDASGCDACASAVPAGWSPVLYSTSGGCPSGFGNEMQVKADPIVRSGACACTATNPSPPSCQTGTVHVHPGCASSALDIAFTNGACAPVSTTLQATQAIAPLAPSGGGCTASAIADDGKLDSTGVTLCAPIAACPINVCEGRAPQGFTACIAHAGDVACPPGPFATKHAIADAVAVDCSQACTTCVADASCSTPTVTFFADTACNNGAFVTATVADGTCRNTGVAGASVTAATYVAATIGVTYAASGPLTARVRPTNGRTVCCR